MSSKPKMNDATAPHNWPLTHTDHSALRDAFQQTQSAVQWLARLANSYMAPEGDDSHLHMVWINEHNTIATGEISGQTIVEMRLPELVLQFRENGELTRHLVELDDRSPAEIEAWSLIELLHRNIDRESYSKALPYDVSDLLSGDAHHYRTLGNETAFAEMTGWLSAAGEVLCRIRDSVVASGLCGAAEVKFSPQNFALFVRMQARAAGSANGSDVEFGFCAGDWQFDEPYFYALSKSGANATGLRNPNTYGRWLGDASATAVLGVGDVLKHGLDHNDIEAFFSVDGRLNGVRNS